jgi:hypothetical protein
MSDEQIAPDKFLLRSLSIVFTLYKRTVEGVINWGESTWHGGAFDAEFGDVKVVIREEEDPQYPQQPDYILNIVNMRTGRAIEEISNRTLSPVTDRVNEQGLNPYSALEEIFKMARRKALKVDDTLDNLLEQLKTPRSK